MRAPVGIAVALFVAASSLSAQTIADAETLFRTGKYDAAIAAFSRLSKDPNPDDRAVTGLALALRAVGRSVEAEAAARRSPGAANALGEAFYERGKLPEAEQAFRLAAGRPGPDSLFASLNLAVLQYDRGARPEALRAFNQFIEYYNTHERLNARALTAIGIACTYLGRDNPKMYQDALKAFDEAAAADPGDMEPRVLTGELFLDRYNSTDAAASFQDVLKVNPDHARARLGLAMAKHFDGDPQAFGMSGMALTVNPNLVDGHVFQARLRLQLEDYAGAVTESETALRFNPASLEALSVLAAASRFAGDGAGFEHARAKVTSLNPTYAEFYNTLSDLAVNSRLYEESVDFARQAIAIDPRSWRGHSLLGLGLLRTTGDVAQARTELETSFQGDPYNVWTKNTLDLLDKFKDFRETRSKRFQFVIHQRESDLLAPYLVDLGEEAFDKLAALYKYAPPTPVRLEVFPSHADFSVRTVGLTGLGALGVSFGSVLAMDSPSARGVGEFNWGSTFWHELTHAFTLGATNNRVPRWFSEGLSVLEERRARPGWGDDVSMEFLQAFQHGQLLPLADLNNGFVRPKQPGQVLLSYYQASLVCELIERDHGMDAILALLKGYRDGLSTREAFRAVLGTELEAFDRSFDRYMAIRFGASIAALHGGANRDSSDDAGTLVRLALSDTTSFPEQMAAAISLMREHQMPRAIPYLERAERLFPEYAEEDTPYWHLAQIWKVEGRLRDAADQLTQLTLLDENNYAANIELASLLEQLHDSAGAARALTRAVFISPHEAAVHVRLARMFAAQGNRAGAVRERRVVVALDPVDRAEAEYQLARAYLEAGDVAAARREVLKALEEAPSFESAQQLLLDIRSRR
ncbi:MAG: tetratricopeptide repeat protein [Gemmatimonadetes bacterium]|nr:tetratricopeptide repeat protein [Gemmatimonadota bacterium]